MRNVCLSPDLSHPNVKTGFLAPKTAFLDPENLLYLCPMQKINAIYAVSENGVIGNRNDLPWHLPDDFKYFKQMTSGKPVIMGRKTSQSLGKPLPNRRNIVITRQADFAPAGFEVAHSLEEAVALCAAEPEISIIGGAEIYRQAFAADIVTHVYETLVHADVEGDTHFSLPNRDQWQVASVDARQADEKNEYAYTFLVLEPKV